MTRLRTLATFGLAKVACIVTVFCAATVVSRAQTFTTLVTFDDTDGHQPTTYAGPLVQGLDGNLYGSTFSGGTSGYYGLVFKMTPTGGLSTVYNFCSQTNCADGAEPGPPILATDGNFYGTTYGGGANNNAVCSGFPCGTVYKISSVGTPSTLHSFCAQPNCADGANPLIQTIQATDGNFYGTAGYGPHGDGEVFRITPSGGFSIPYSFCAQTNCTDGSGPSGVIVQAKDGNIYGTAFEGGAHGGGTFFRLTLNGRLTTLYSFCSLTNCADGKGPGNIILAADGNFYGRTFAGGTNSYGTVFKITLGGALTTLYNCGQTNCPEGELGQATNGTLYGGIQFGGNTSGNCGSIGCGTLFSLDLGLPPFVETLPNSGKVGAKVTVLGTNLTGATSVGFNGAAATFTVVSSSEIKTAVPAGAKTGRVTVTTPSSGTLHSNLIFKVTPQIKSFTPTSGPVGTSVTITGVSLTQTTTITFGGVKAPFKVNSDTQVTATVPTGAKTGRIAITTPGGSTASATSFTVN